MSDRHNAYKHFKEPNSVLEIIQNRNDSDTRVVIPWKNHQGKVLFLRGNFSRKIGILKDKSLLAIFRPYMYPYSHQSREDSGLKNGSA